jgi:hypothetical protein
MQRQAVLALQLLVILAFSWSSASVHASSLNYSIHDEKVTVSLSLHFFQNATTIPSLNGSFTGTSAEDLAFALAESIGKKVKDATASSVSGGLVSDKNWINATIQFEAAGVSQRKGDLLVFNCSWIPFNVSRDLRLQDLRYNLIGATYIRPAFEKYLDYERPPLNETIERVTYLSGQDPVPPSLAANTAGNATLLDFSNLAPPIETWQRMSNLTKGSTIWVYDPAPAVDLTMTVTPREGTPFSARAFYGHNATVLVDGPAHAEHNTIVADVSGGFEPLLMLAVILVTFVVAVLASWTYRSRRRQIARRRK